MDLSGDADEQAVGGGQGLHVKLAGGVLHALGLEREHLDLLVVGGRADLRVTLLKFRQNGDRQRRALHRVGSAAQLVDED